MVNADFKDFLKQTMPKIAIVHDWLNGMRGGEKCLEVFCEIFPDADLYTLLYVKGALTEPIERMNIIPSLFQSLPLAEKLYRHYLPVMPWFIERFDLSGYDLVLSSSHCVAKGVRVEPDTRHICYCYSPMRYIWDQWDAYFGKGRMGFWEERGMSLCVDYLRSWDKQNSEKVDQFLAISKFVSERIKKYYGRDSEIIYPPVNSSYYLPGTEAPRDYFLMVSAFAPYKKVDLAIKVFNRLKLPLKIIGKGQMQAQLQAMAGPTIEFFGWMSDEEVRDAYAGCRAFVFPGEEDFGITPLEAQSCGRPVIAYGKGGALETIVPANPDGKINMSKSATGLYFYEQEEESLEEAILTFQKIEKEFDSETIRKNALRFERDEFKKQMESFLKEFL